MARKIRNAEGDSEEEIDGNIGLFLRNVHDSDATKYFFSREFEGMTLEEIVDNALRYKLIQLSSQILGFLLV